MQRKTFHPRETNKKEWFRVRKESDKITMTYKCIHSHDLSGTEEVEIVVDNYENAAEMLIKSGLKNTSTQENMRECWRL
jgi:adenylate cyclase class IV